MGVQTLTLPLDLPVHWNADIFELVRAVDHTLLPQKFHHTVCGQKCVMK